MIGTFEIRCHAAKPQMPLPPMFAFKDSPSSLRLLEIPKKIGEWNITTVKVAVNYPDNTTNIYTASRNGNVWVVTFNGCSITGKVANGLEVLADGLDENGDAVNGYVLGVGDIYILDRDADIEEAVSKHTMRYCDETPETPVGGDVVIENGALKIYDGTQWISVDIDLSEYATKSELETTTSTLDNKIDSTKTELESSIAEVASDIPTTTSELTNDSGFITLAEVPTKTSELINDSGYITSTEVPKKVSELENDTGYITANALPTKVSELENDSGFITASAIPSNVGAFTNDVGYLTASSTEFKNKRDYDDQTFTMPSDVTVIPFVNDWDNKRWARAYVQKFDVTYDGVEHELAEFIIHPEYGMMWYKASTLFMATRDGQTFYLRDNNTNIMATTTISALKSGVVDFTYDGKSGSITLFAREKTNFALDYQTITGTLEIKVDGETVGWYHPQNPLGEEINIPVPSNVSQLNNDAGYLTTVSWNDVQDKPSIPTKTSDLTNDSDFTTNTALNTGLALKQDKLSDAQVSAIDSVVDERETVVTYTDDTTATYNIVGELKHDQIYVDGKIPKTVRVGDGVTAIESNCFLGNTFLTSITFGKDVAYLNAGCLSGTGLTSIVVPNKVKEIPNSTITHNSNLTELVLNDGLETLGIIPQNTRLAMLKIPSTVTTINSDAFRYATALTEVTFEGKTLAEVQDMSNYPWGISDTSIIKTWNDTSKEYVDGIVGTINTTLDTINGEVI